MSDLRDVSTKNKGTVYGKLEYNKKLHQMFYCVYQCKLQCLLITIRASDLSSFSSLIPTTHFGLTDCCGHARLTETCNWVSSA